jgi:hypothetical protein
MTFGAVDAAGAVCSVADAGASLVASCTVFVVEPSGWVTVVVVVVVSA